MLKTITILMLISASFTSLAQNEAIDLLAPQEEPQMPCSIFESKDWKAWIETQPDQTHILNITAEAMLPTPGFIIDWKKIDQDENDGQDLTIALTTTPPNGIVIQVITPTPINIQMETPENTLSSLTLLCADKELAKLTGIKAKD